MPPQEQTQPNQDELRSMVREKTVNDEATVPAPMEQLDPYEPVERRSIFHRESFLMQFASKEGPRSVLFLIIFLAMGLGSTIGVVPAVMTDRYARLNHGYNGTMDCADYEMAMKPEACLNGSADAQNAHAVANLVNNIFTFATSSLMGSLSDEYGRRGS